MMGRGNLGTPSTNQNNGSSLNFFYRFNGVLAIEQRIERNKKKLKNKNNNNKLNALEIACLNQLHDDDYDQFHNFTIYMLRHRLT